MTWTPLATLAGGVVVVTGASSGLGVAAARAFAEVGAHLVLAARRTDLLDALAIELSDKGAEVRVVACDVTVIDDCETVARRAVEQFGRIEVLVNNAGVGQAGSALREEPHIFQRTIVVNLNGAYRMSRACAPHMRPGSSIVIIASVLGKVASLMPQAGYVASEAELLGLTRDLARQWTGRRGIRANALCPGYFVSEITDGEGAELVEDRVRALLGPAIRPSSRDRVSLAVPGRTRVFLHDRFIPGGRRWHVRSCLTLPRHCRDELSSRWNWFFDRA